MFPIETQLEFEMDTEDKNVIGKSFLWDFNIGDFFYADGKPKLSSDLAGIKVWVEKLIRTQKDKYLVYADSQYGVNTEDLIGNTYNSSFTKSEFEREIKEAIEIHPDILNITLFQMNHMDEFLNISFTVNLRTGTSFAEELNFYV